ncbi:MAG: AAA family ATPase [Patescibacteria group bacterium]
MKTKHIVIEGMPGAGKTSLIEILKKEEGFVVYKETYSPEVELLTSDFEKERFYLMEEIRKNKEIILNKVNVFDRNFLSILAYSYALDRNRLCEKGLYDWVKKLYLEYVANGAIKHPDKYVVLLISTSESINRRKKYQSDPGYAIWFNEGFLDAFYDFYLNVATEFTKNLNVNVIEGDDIAQTAVLEKVVKIINT